MQITIFLLLPETLGQAEDQVCAGPLAVLLCIQLGYGADSEHIFKLLKSPLITTLQDPTARIPARASVSKIFLIKRSWNLHSIVTSGKNKRENR